MIVSFVWIKNMVSPMDNNNKGRSRLFGCFNSPTNEGTDQSGFDSMPPPPPTPPPLSDDDILRRKRTTLRNLSGSLKSIIFKSTLVKKLKSKRPSRREFYYRSISSLSSKLKKPVKKLQPASKGYSEMEDIADDSDHYSLFSPTSSASSCASSVSSSVASESAKISDSSLDLPLVVSGMSYGRHNAIKNADGGMKFKYSAAATGMCMFLVCLVALVFWGKAIAIVTCTSAWLFWAANYHRSHRSMGGEVAVKEVAVSNAVLDSEEDKKRVIMEGLLERAHPRFIHP